MGASNLGQIFWRRLRGGVWARLFKKQNGGFPPPCSFEVGSSPPFGVKAPAGGASRPQHQASPASAPRPIPMGYGSRFVPLLHSDARKFAPFPVCLALFVGRFRFGRISPSFHLFIP